MDILSYEFYSGNKLTRIVDTGNKDFGFRDGTELFDEYQYDTNGNLTRDLNKGIGTLDSDGIAYNHLNMPTKITVTGSNAGTLDYVYAADRTKLRKINSNGTTTDYIGNYIYENGNLVQFFHAEGYIEPDGSGGYDYIYQYSDHLGNVRLSYQDINNDGSVDQSEILQERNYYPFGLEHKGYNSMVQGVENNYKQFQGQEWTEDLGLNIHEWKYRISDPAIGRFWQIDPLAEDYSYQSPYNFSENRLIDSAELEGLERIYAADGKFIDQVGDSQEIRVLQNTDGTSQAQTLISTANNTELSSEERAAASSALNSASFHGFEKTEDAARSFAFSNNAASMEANDGNGLEFGAAINTVTLSNGNGGDIEGTTNNTVAVLGSTVIGDEGGVSPTAMLAADNIQFGSGESSTLPGKLAAFVHTHGQGSNDFSGTVLTRGGRLSGDKQISSQKGIPIFMSNKRGRLKVFDYNTMSFSSKGQIISRNIPIGKKK